MVFQERTALIVAALLTLLGGGVFLASCQSGEHARTETTGRVLRAASNMRHPPFSSWDDQGKAVGLEVELVEQAAARLGWTVRWEERSFGELLEAVAEGEIDLAVSTIGITPERLERVAFSRPYFQTEIVALVRQDPTAPRTLVELARARIGADRATTSYGAARAHWPEATLVGAVLRDKTWPQMVQEGTVDAFVVDASDQERLQTLSGIELRRLAEPLARERFGIALRHGETALLGALNEAIATRTSNP